MASHSSRVRIAVQLDNERRVIEVAPPAMMARGFDGLENLSVEADGGVTTAPSGLGFGSGRGYFNPRSPPSKQRRRDRGSQ